MSFSIEIPTTVRGGCRILTAAAFVPLAGLLRRPMAPAASVPAELSAALDGVLGLLLGGVARGVARGLALGGTLNAADDPLPPVLLKPTGVRAGVSAAWH